jgi:hypothetical protein
LSFADKTATLSPYPLRSFEVDYSMQMLDIDGSGIKAYFMAGSTTPGTLDAQGLLDNSLQNNYILLNDGTGKLHVYYHEEFLSLSQQIERYYGVNDQLYGSEKRFISFLTPEKHINFLMVVLGQDQVNGKSVLTETLINVPTDLNPTADFKQNIEVLDRNLSKNIRTWAGNDTINSLNANTSKNINSPNTETTIDGGYGIDTSVYNAARSAFTISKVPSIEKFNVASTTAGVQDQLTNIERLKFNDKSIAVDLNGNAGTTAKILGAVFGKDSISNKSYMGIGLSFLDAGWSYDNLAGLALDAAGANTNDQIISLLWTNVIGTTPTAAEKQPFIALLENGMSAGALAHLAADTSFNATNINLVGLAQTGIEFIPVG